MHRFGILIVAALFAGLVQAKEVFHFSGPRGSILLYDAQGTCPDGMNTAMWVDHQGGPSVPGCWFEREANDSLYVLIAYEDGDRGAYHKSDFEATP